MTAAQMSIREAPDGSVVTRNARCQLFLDGYEVWVFVLNFDQLGFFVYFLFIVGDFDTSSTVAILMMNCCFL